MSKTFQMGLRTLLIPALLLIGAAPAQNLPLSHVAWDGVVADAIGVDVPAPSRALGPPAGQLTCAVCDHHDPEQEEHHFHTWECESGASCYSCTEGRPGHAGCHTGWAPSSCDDWHAHCGIQTVVQAVDAYHDGDLATVAVMLEEFPETFRFNVARSAVQAVDCHGRTVAHLPLRQLSVARMLP